MKNDVLCVTTTYSNRFNTVTVNVETVSEDYENICLKNGTLGVEIDNSVYEKRNCNEPYTTTPFVYPSRDGGMLYSKQYIIEG